VYLTMDLRRSDLSGASPAHIRRLVASFLLWKDAGFDFCLNLKQAKAEYAKLP
jgi:hypothetical protein